MEYDKQCTVVERLGIGTVLNPFNFIAEEFLQINFSVASPKAIIYEIDKQTFFRIIQNDKKLLRTILKMMMENFDPVDPELHNLDFERPNKNL